MLKAGSQQQVEARGYEPSQHKGTKGANQLTTYSPPAINETPEGSEGRVPARCLRSGVLGRSRIGAAFQTAKEKKTILKRLEKWDRKYAIIHINGK